MAKIQFVDEVSADVTTKMEEDLVRYEQKHGVDINYRRFSLVLRDDNNEAVGVLNAYTAFAEIYIDDMWVDESCRGQGYGKKLIDALWERFEGEGFNNVNLCTSEFQAPEFYKKCGFTLEFVRENTKNPKLTKYFFVKFFKNDKQMQGVV